MQARSVIGWAILLFAALGSTALLIRSRDEPATPEATPRLGIGYYLTDAKLSGTGADGQLLYRLTASTVVQAPADGSARMEQVQVDYEPAGHAPWRLTADEGRLRAGAKIVELSGNVVAATRDADGPAATVSTDYLEFDPATETATTRSKVSIEYAGSVVHATGLRALLREERLQLPAEVRGRYAR